MVATILLSFLCKYCRRGERDDDGERKEHGLERELHICAGEDGCESVIESEGMMSRLRGTSRFI